MKNNNELKPLFRNVDSKPNPLISDREEVGIVEFKSFYNNINQVLPGMMIQERPVDTMDLDIIRHNLCLTFENRVRNILRNTTMTLYSRFNNLENKVRQFIASIAKDEYYSYAIIDVKDQFDSNRIVDEIIERIPYITDLIFYFNINQDFTCIKTIALNISTMVYNRLRFEISTRDKNILTNEEVEMLNEVINTEFKKFTNSLIEELHKLIQESNIYFVAGDYEVDENGNILHYLVKEQQAEFGTVDAIQVIEECNEQERSIKFLQALEDIF